MLEKDLYDSWKSRMELCMQNREHGRMILESVEHGLLIWPTIEENEMTRTKKYAELSPTEKIQADCDMKYNTSGRRILRHDDIHYLLTSEPTNPHTDSPGSGYQQKRHKTKAKMTKLSMEWKRRAESSQSPKMSKSESITEESSVKQPELKNTIECNLNPSDGPGKPNSIFMKTVKTKWALNQLQQPICVQLTKTVKTLKAQS
ncbi:hypothetical protein Tco_0482324 [Tanacetum coccineum]